MTVETVSQVLGGLVLGGVALAMGWPVWCAFGLIVAIRLLDNQTWRNGK